MCKMPEQTGESPGASRRQQGPQITIRVDGRNISAREGETVHAALTAAGIYRLRRLPDGSARGVFCGMGICYECLVTIDGVPFQRACMTRVRGQMEIQTRDNVCTGGDK